MSEPTYKIAQALHARRAAVGLKKYGQPLTAHTPGCMIVHAIEEAADLTEYLLAEAQRRKIVLETLNELSKEMHAELAISWAYRIEKLYDLLGGKSAIEKYDDILGGGTVAENATVAPDPRDEALRVIADGAEEDVSELTGVEGQKVWMFCGDVPHDEKCPYIIATAAIAATPAEFLAAHDAAVKVAVLREVREKIRELTKLSEGTPNIIGVRAAMDILRSEADRIAKEAPNA